ncbi:MAG: OsmC family protein [Rubrivivax sp.]|nr:OsmC family protein [Rubrivivax sp.]
MTASNPAIATAVQRVRSVLKRRPETGLHEDAPATARWQGGTRVVASHANGAQVLTDLPSELGGSGDQVTPGWLFRAGLAACATTSIVLKAAAEGIELAALEVRAGSRSDMRGLLGMNDEAGQPVHADPSDLHMQVRIEVPGEAPDRLRALVERAVACSPVPCMVGHANALALHIDIAPA